MEHKYIAHPLPSQGPHPSNPRPARTPVVEMSKPAAEALSQALSVARSMYVERIGKIERSKADPGPKAHALGELREALATLQAFQAAHEEAHGLGGN